MTRQLIGEMEPLYQFTGVLFSRFSVTRAVTHVINNINALNLSEKAERVRVRKLSSSKLAVEVSGLTADKVLSGATAISASLKGKWKSFVLYNARLSLNGTEVEFTYEDTSLDYRIAYNDTKALVPKVGQLRLDRRENNVWNFRTGTPHMIISGSTGSGKSQALSAYIQALATRKAMFRLVDPKHAELSELGKKLNVQVARNWDEALDTLNEVNDVMTTRQDNNDKRYKPLFLVIEEMGALMALAPSNKEKATYLSLLKRVLVMARSANIHIISVMQTATAENVGGIELRAQFGVRILLGSPQQEELQFLLPAGTPATAFGKFAGYVSIEGEGVNRIQTPSKYA